MSEIGKKCLKLLKKIISCKLLNFPKDTELYTIKDGEAIVLSSIPFNANC